MTTEAKKRIDWHTFIENDAAGERVDVFRKGEWRQIRHELRSEFGVNLLHEPCWVDAGTAVFWHRDQVLKPGSNADVPEYIEGEWGPTSATPANNASQIMHFLRKGFLLRPPSEGAGVEEYEAAEPAGASGETDMPYRCNRMHMAGRPGEAPVRMHNDGAKFPNWDAYIRHCQHFRERLEHEPPADVKKRMLRWTYYCMEHNVGFLSVRLSSLHMRQKPHLMSIINIQELKDADQSGTRSGERKPHGAVSSSRRDDGRSPEPTVSKG